MQNKKKHIPFNLHAFNPYKVFRAIQQTTQWTTFFLIQEAVEVYKAAIIRRPSHYAPQSLYNMLGEAHSKLEQLNEAETWYKQALKAKPDHIPAHLTMAKLLQKRVRQII